MKKYFCPSCAAPIALANGMQHGYCKVCGDAISYADVAKMKVSSQLRSNQDRLRALDPSALYTAAHNAWEEHGLELMKIAAEKGYMPADLYLGIVFYRAENWGDCKKHLKAAVQAGSVDAKALLLVLQYRTDSDPDADDILEKLQAICKKSFENPTVLSHCQDYIKKIQADIQQEQARQAALDALAAQSTSWTDRTFDIDINWKPGKFDTFYTDARNGQRVFYDDGQYVNESGQQVPIQWMVE